MNKRILLGVCLVSWASTEMLPSRAVAQSSITPTVAVGRQRVPQGGVASSPQVSTPLTAGEVRRIKQKRAGLGAVTAGNANSTPIVSRALAGLTGSDTCATADPIVGTGLFPFDNSLATTDGPAHAACLDLLQDQIENDVWFCWTAPCNGPVEIKTCGTTFVDTRLAVYNGCACPVSDATLLDCNDDSCLLQSTVNLLAVAGNTYLIRAGNFPGEPPGSGELSIACLDLPCTQPGGQCQGVDFNNGNTSDRTNFITAENFTADVTGDITNVCWWGSYAFDDPTPDTFEVRYYLDDAGFPGALIGGPFVQSAATLGVTGPVNTVMGIDFPVFAYNGTHAPVGVVAGECYWLEITNAPDQGQAWFWQFGTTGDSFALTDGSPPDGYAGNDISANDLAFCLDIAIGDPGLCTAPNPCFGATGECCAAKSTPGCGVESCCSQVCACDDFCCLIAWDVNCAGMGLGGNGCGAAALCNNVCGMCGTIESSDPPNCEIDARIPHDRDNALVPFGWNSISLTMSNLGDTSCNGCLATVADFTVTVAPATAAVPAIASVVCDPINANVVTITFDRIIPTNHWTCVTANASGTKACLGYLPGDVNASLGTNAQDIGAVVDHLNSVAGRIRPIWGCDINRSAACNSQDIAEEVNLLNGASTFNIWNNEKINAACPSIP